MHQDHAPSDPRADLLRTLLKQAGQAALDRFQIRSVSIKADGSKVTDADLIAHDILTQGLAQAFPHDLITSEEAPIPVDPAPGQGVWYVDPIDGTGAFTEGLAHWGPTVTRMVDGKLDIGAFFMPRLDEFFLGICQGGAWRNGVRLHASLADQSERLHTLYVPSRAHRTFPIAWPGKIRALGSTAAHLAMVATGSAAAAVIPLWATWDVGAGLLLAREAGAKVVDLHGEPFEPALRPGEPFVAGFAPVLPSLLDALRTSRASWPRS